MEGQLLLPFLGSDYGVALQDGTLPLRFDAQHGAFYVEHYEHHFPICPHRLRRSAQGIRHAEPLKSLADRFSTLSYQTDAHSLAIAACKTSCANWPATRPCCKPSSTT